MRAELAELTERWQAEKARIAAIQHAKAQIEEAREEAERAEREGDLQRAAELRYGRLPELARELEDEQTALEAHGGERLLNEEVGADDIAQVVAAWTGIPVSRLLEGEMQKLVALEERLHERVVGQDEAVEAVVQRDPPLALGPRRSRTGRSARSCSSAPPASARPSSPARSRRCSSTTSAPCCASTCPSTWSVTPSRG